MSILSILNEVGVLQVIASVKRYMLCGINGEMKVSTPIESCLVTIDEDCGFIVNGVKIKQNPLASP